MTVHGFPGVYSDSSASKSGALAGHCGFREEKMLKFGVELIKKIKDKHIIILRSSVVSLCHFLGRSRRKASVSQLVNQLFR